MWIQHLFSLIGTTIRIFFDAIGSTLLGKLVDCAFAGAVGFVILLKVRKKSGLRAMIQHLLNQYGDPLKFALWCALIVYGPIYIWSVGKAVYEDHQGLVASLRKERKAIGLDAVLLQKTTESLKVQLNECGIKGAALEGINQTLTSQNRDQQNSIDNCQTQALKLLQPPEVKVQPRVIPTGENGGLGKYHTYEMIFITNKPLSYPRIDLRCELPILSVSGTIIGDGIEPVIVPQPKKLSDYEYVVAISSPSWTPENPFYIKFTLQGAVVTPGPPCTNKVGWM